MKLNAIWSQIKEKFGGLRMYYIGMSPRLDFITEAGLATGRMAEAPGSQESRIRSIREIVDEAEESSLSTCCKCGSPGSHQMVDHWYFTFCLECLSSYVELKRADQKYLGSRPR